MHRLRMISLLTVAALPLFVVPVAAQMYPGEDVIVNPGAVPSTRIPGQSTITLHPPRRHRVHHAAAKANRSGDISLTDTGAEPAAPADSTEAPKKTRTRHKTEPAQADSASAVPFTLGEDQQILGEPASPPAKAETSPEKQTRNSAQTQSSFIRHINFEPNSTEPQKAQIDPIRMMAADLNAAIGAGATSIQLVAYGGAPGDKSSDAKRVSLKRAISIRQILIDNGVPSSRIDVQAKGGITDNGVPDRVDVIVRTN